MQNLRLFKSLFLAATTLILVACTGNANKEKPVKNGVDAEILNLQDSTLYFYSEINPINKIKGKEASFKIQIDVDSNGIFVRPLNLEEGYYILEHDNIRSLYFIEKGKRLSLDFDAAKPTEQPDFSGALKYESRYLYDRFLAHAKFTSKQKAYFTYSEADFVNEVNQLRGKLDTALVTYITNHPTGSAYFMEQESLTNLYFSAAYLEAYPAKRTINTPLSETYYAKLNQLDINNQKAINNPAFYLYIQNYVWSRVGAPVNTQNVYQQINFVDTAISVPEYQDFLLFQSAKEVALWTNNENKSQMLDTLVTLIHHPEIKAFLLQNIQNDTAALSLKQNQTITQDQ